MSLFDEHGRRAFAILTEPAIQRNDKGSGSKEPQTNVECHADAAKQSRLERSHDWRKPTPATIAPSGLICLGTHFQDYSHRAVHVVVEAETITVSLDRIPGAIRTWLGRSRYPRLYFARDLRDLARDLGWRTPRGVRVIAEYSAPDERTVVIRRRSK